MSAVQAVAFVLGVSVVLTGVLAALALTCGDTSEQSSRNGSLWVIESDAMDEIDEITGRLDTDLTHEAYKITTKKTAQGLPLITRDEVLEAHRILLAQEKSDA